MRGFLARHLLTYLALLVLAVTVAGAVVARGAIAAAWRALPGWTLPLVLAFSLVNYALRFVRWQLLLQRLGEHPPLAGSARIWFACLAMVVTPARIGELAKLGLLRARFRIPVRRSAAALLVDRVADVLSLLLLACIGLAAAAASLALPALLLAALAATFYLSTAERPRRALLRGLERWALTRRHAAAADELLRANAHLLRPAGLLPAVGLGTLAWMAECLGLYWITLGLGAPVPWTTATWIYAAATLAGNMTFIPGGLGGTEVSLVALLRQQQVPHDAALAAAALVRAATLWFAVAIGVVVTLWARRTLALAHLEELESEAT